MEEGEEKQSEFRNIKMNLLTDIQHLEEKYEAYQQREWAEAERQINSWLLPWCRHLATITKVKLFIS